MPSPQNGMSSGSCQLHVLTELFELTFNEEGSLYLACNEERVLSKSIICGHGIKFVMNYIIFRQYIY